jgi:hypothetical protein
MTPLSRKSAQARRCRPIGLRNEPTNKDAKHLACVEPQLLQPVLTSSSCRSRIDRRHSSSRLANDERKVKFLMQESGFARQIPQQILTNALPCDICWSLDRCQRWSQMPAPFEIVEADDREVTRNGNTLAFRFKQNPVGDHVVAADDPGGTIAHRNELAGYLTSLIEFVLNFDQPLCKWIP